MFGATAFPCWSLLCMVSVLTLADTIPQEPPKQEVTGQKGSSHSSEELPVKLSVSQTKCLEYQSQICRAANTESSGAGLLAAATESFSGDRDVEEEYQATTEYENKEIQNDNIGNSTPGVFVYYVHGGVAALPQELPYMALIGFGDKDDISWGCGGTLISERFVLSAAHCNRTESRSGVVFANWVRLGELDLASDSDGAQPQDYEVEERIVHEDYRPPARYNDIMLLRLRRQVEFNDHIAPACLHSAAEHPSGLCTVSGWGKVEEGRRRSSKLLKAGLQFLTNDECVSRFKSSVHLPSGVDGKTMMCAWDLGKDACKGDSGGPLTLADHSANCLALVAGITSLGFRYCVTSDHPGIYTRVSHYVPWIEQRVWPTPMNASSEQI